MPSDTFSLTRYKYKPEAYGYRFYFYAPVILGQEETVYGNYSFSDILGWCSTNLDPGDYRIQSTLLTVTIKLRRKKDAMRFKITYT